MGAGASLTRKFRNIIVVKAYNARPEGTSVEDQFKDYVQVDEVRRMECRFGV
jgi:hypothetical protein